MSRNPKEITFKIQCNHKICSHIISTILERVKNMMLIWVQFPQMSLFISMIWMRMVFFIILLLKVIEKSGRTPTQLYKFKLLHPQLDQVKWMTSSVEPQPIYALKMNQTHSLVSIWELKGSSYQHVTQSGIVTAQATAWWTGNLKFRTIRWTGLCSIEECIWLEIMMRTNNSLKFKKSSALGVKRLLGVLTRKCSAILVSMDSASSVSFRLAATQAALQT